LTELKKIFNITRGPGKQGDRPTPHGVGRKVRTPSPTKLVGDKRAAGNTRRG